MHSITNYIKQKLRDVDAENSSPTAHTYILHERLQCEVCVYTQISVSPRQRRLRSFPRSNQPWTGTQSTLSVFRSFVQIFVQTTKSVRFNLLLFRDSESCHLNRSNLGLSHPNDPIAVAAGGCWQRGGGVNSSNRSPFRPSNSSASCKLRMTCPDIIIGFGKERTGAVVVHRLLLS